MTKTQQPERLTAMRLDAGMTVRVANRAQGDSADWHTLGAKPTKNGKFYVLVDEAGDKIGTYGYATKFEVRSAETRKFFTTDGVEIVPGLAVYTNEMNVAVVTGPAGHPEANGDQWFETETWQTWEGEQIPGGRRGPIMNGERLATVYEGVKAADVVAGVKAAAKPTKAAKRAAKAAKTRPATPAVRKPRVSKAMAEALRRLHDAEADGLTRKELGADPMVVKAMGSHGWAKIDRSGDDRSTDWIELTADGAVLANDLAPTAS